MVENGDLQKHSDDAFDEPDYLPPRGWAYKFRYAFRGATIAFQTQSSFWVHVPVALIVIALGIFLQVSRVELCILLLCIGLVLTLELVNTAIEELAKATTRKFNKHIQMALDVSSAAVLVASLIAVAIGLIIFLQAR